ncbi:MAG: hypothetical protein Q7N95_15310 [Alphaproteobacteria bacterium]|nr:hypothetical protein [Alphaproteobacteria bacterium]
MPQIELLLEADQTISSSTGADAVEVTHCCSPQLTSCRDEPNHPGESAG